MSSVLRLAFQWGCAAVFQSKIWPSNLIAPNSRNIELIFFRHELFSPSSPRSIKQAEFKFSSVSCSWVMKAEELQPEQIGIAGFSSCPRIIKQPGWFCWEFSEHSPLGWGQAWKVHCHPLRNFLEKIRNKWEMGLAWKPKSIWSHNSGLFP